MTLSPFVYWAQSENNLFIKIDLKDVQDPSIKLEKRKLQFESKGVGAQGSNNYGFSLDFYNDIETDDSTCKVRDSKIDFNIVKSEKSWWPRLTSTPQKPAWLKIDFDRWQSEDPNSDEENPRDVRDDYQDLYKRLQQDELGYSTDDLKKVYLFIYNLVMFVGFTYVISVLSIRYLKDGNYCFLDAYNSVGSAVTFLHFLMTIDIILAFFNITPGNFIAPLVQIGSRIMLIVLLIDPEPKLHGDPVIYYLYFTWAMAEIIRYPYYLMQIINVNFAYLTWLRYTAWMILYPIGLTLESIVLYKSIQFLEESGRLACLFPNKYNFSFYPPNIVRVYLLFFMVPTSAFFLSHMYGQRAKKLRFHKIKTK